jgi:hypothetical protein
MVISAETFEESLPHYKPPTEWRTMIRIGHLIQVGGSRDVQTTADLRLATLAMRYEVRGQITRRQPIPLPLQCSCKPLKRYCSAGPGTTATDHTQSALA